MGHDRQGATETTRSINEAVYSALDFSDDTDFDRVSQGFIGTDTDLVVRNEQGDVVWDMQQYAFEAQDAPDTANPSLWRQEQLNNRYGLFKVVDGVYQVRGYDVSNITFVEGRTGWIVVDPLACVETAAAALDLVNRHLGERPVTAVIYSHSHVDHFGGVAALISAEDTAAGRVRVVAPEGFVEHTVSENIYAGIAMGRRTTYQFGQALPKDEKGFLGSGVGKSFSTGRITLIHPTDVISETGTTLTLDGIDVEFQNTPFSEAPAEMQFYFPEYRTLCIAENCAASIHNLLTMRGAQVRDAKSWSGYLDEAIDLYGDRSDVLIMSHNWPRWGTEYLKEYIGNQRDLYRFIHDQTLRLANHGYTMEEISEVLRLPAELDSNFYARGYYGTVSHDSKAVFQRYLGWWDGNPANLHRHPPVAAGQRYVAAMGGAQRVLEVAQEAFDEGDYRWVAELVNHLVFAEPDNSEARELQARALEQLGYQSESGIWRGFYLSGAFELRNGIDESLGMQTEQGAGENGLIAALELHHFLDSMATRVIPAKAAGLDITLNFNITDSDQQYTLYLKNSVLRHKADHNEESADATITMTRDALNAIAIDTETGFANAVASGELTIDGDAVKLAELFGAIDDLDMHFPIVTPRETA
ncbi:MAG: MBL fold metallo-hydrolase [Actinobacteria bacterium]|nr:MBL fold metallo-hydrolase [Actinomycetota bacterium]